MAVERRSPKDTFDFYSLIAGVSLTRVLSVLMPARYNVYDGYTRHLETDTMQSGQIYPTY